MKITPIKETLEEIKEDNKWREDTGSWLKFLNLLEPGDELCHYNDIQFLSGTTGYCIVRNEKVLYRYMTAMS